MLSLGDYNFVGPVFHPFKANTKTCLYSKNLMKNTFRMTVNLKICNTFN